MGSRDGVAERTRSMVACDVAIASEKYPRQGSNLHWTVFESAASSSWATRAMNDCVAGGALSRERLGETASRGIEPRLSERNSDGLPLTYNAKVFDALVHLIKMSKLGRFDYLAEGFSRDSLKIGRSRINRIP